MRILVVSPIATHPNNQGNSARIDSLCKQLQSFGHTVHLLYYPLEGLSSSQADEMSVSWDYFHSMPCNLPDNGKSKGYFYGIDDWYDPKLGVYALELHKRWCFDMVIVNYVWFSAVLNSFPSSILKVIDTHDVFGDRHLKFMELGLDPEWFYTTVDEERKGLMRADCVIAIQDKEEKYFNDLLKDTDTKVLTIGHILPARAIAHSTQHDLPIIGYLGSGNPFNVNSITNFANYITKSEYLLKNYRFILAGTICDKVKSLPPFEIYGKIDNLDDFYNGVDVVINPMKSGTGLKIKTLEALSYGKAFIGTESAYEGININICDSNGNELMILNEELSKISDLNFTALDKYESYKIFINYINQQYKNLKLLLEIPLRE
jgi:hypothetical protein